MKKTTMAVFMTGCGLTAAIVLAREAPAQQVASARTEASVVSSAPVSAPSRAPARARAAAAPSTDSGSVLTFNREMYDYPADGRRDPFFSLIKSSELRPVITDLRLVAVAFDAAGGNSVAIMRDLVTKEQYRVKVGQQLGRMRVARIDTKTVTFTLEEYGFSRQQTLAMGDSTTQRKP